MTTTTSEKKYYRSEDGCSLFRFEFVPTADYIQIYCILHPPLGGRDPSPHKTHLFDDGRVCLAAGREPRDQERAEALAKQWAEYYLEYRRTGTAQH